MTNFSQWIHDKEKIFTINNLLKKHLLCFRIQLITTFNFRTQAFSNSTLFFGLFTIDFKEVKCFRTNCYRIDQQKKSSFWYFINKIKRILSNLKFSTKNKYQYKNYLKRTENT